MSTHPAVRRREDPQRREVVGQAQGIVLEVGAGGGQNFPYYDPHHVVCMEASEPDEAMLAVARRHLVNAAVRIKLTRTPVEALPFPTAQFDSVVATLIQRQGCGRSGGCSNPGVRSCCLSMSAGRDRWWR